MPRTCAVQLSISTFSTPSKAATFSPGAVAASRGRNKLEVFLASRMGVPGGISAYWLTKALTSC